MRLREPLDRRMVIVNVAARPLFGNTVGAALDEVLGRHIMVAGLHR
jgi:hypothetical protein